VSEDISLRLDSDESIEGNLAKNFVIYDSRIVEQAQAPNSLYVDCRDAIKELLSILTPHEKNLIEMKTGIRDRENKGYLFLIKFVQGGRSENERAKAVLQNSALRKMNFYAMNKGWDSSYFFID